METSFLAQQFVPLMFCGLFVFLLTGFPVAFALAATGLAFGFIGMEAGIFPPSLFQALPLRIFGIIRLHVSRTTVFRSSGTGSMRPRPTNARKCRMAAPARSDCWLI